MSDAGDNVERDDAGRLPPPPPVPSSDGFGDGPDAGGDDAGDGFVDLPAPSGLPSANTVESGGRRRLNVSPFGAVMVIVGWAVLQLVGGTVAIVVGAASGLFGDLATVAGGDLVELDPTFLMSVALVGQLVGLVGLMAFVWFGPGWSETFRKAKSLSAGHLVLWVGIGFVTVLVVQAVAFAATQLGADLESQQVALELLGQGALVTVLVWVSSVILAPVGEELLFRGVLWDAFERRFSVPVALAVTSVLFGLVHVTEVTSLILLGALMAAGVVFGWMRLKFDSLWAPVLAHVGFNGLMLTLATFAG